MELIVSMLALNYNYILSKKKLLFWRGNHEKFNDKMTLNYVCSFTGFAKFI